MSLTYNPDPPDTHNRWIPGEAEPRGGPNLLYRELVQKWEPPKENTQNVTLSSLKSEAEPEALLDALYRPHRETPSERLRLQGQIGKLESLLMLMIVAFALMTFVCIGQAVHIHRLSSLHSEARSLTVAPYEAGPGSQMSQTSPDPAPRGGWWRDLLPKGDR